MNSRGLIISVFIVVAFAAFGLMKHSLPTQPAKPTEINISPAISLKDALTEIQNSYNAKRPNVKLVFNFGASSSLQKQIEQGAPVDIFISASQKEIDELELKNLIINSSRKNLVKNQLVLVVPINSPVEVNSFQDLSKPEVSRIALGEPALVPAGRYGQQVLQKLDLWDQLRNKAVFAKDVRTVLTYVETGNVDAGIVYKTDALIGGRFKTVATAPEDTHQPIVYPFAIIAGTKNLSEAENFAAFLITPESKAIFKKYGFSTAEGD